MKNLKARMILNELEKLITELKEAQATEITSKKWIEEANLMII
ncbi:hypothetical protein [Halobacteriovorax sp.]